MRWAAGLAALLVAALQVGLFVLAQRQLQVLVGPGEPAGTAARVPWLWAAGSVAPWVVAAALFGVGSTRRAVAVVLTASAVVMAAGLGGLEVLLDHEGRDLEISSLGGVGVWTLALVAGLLALAARPPGPWRVDAPGPVGWYVTVAVLGWLPAAFRTTQFAPPGSPRAFVEASAAHLEGLDAVAAVATAVVAGLLLFVAPRLRPDVGGTVLLAYGVPTLLADVGRLSRAVTGEHLIVTPSGVLGLIGVTGLVLAGLRWASRRVAAGEGPRR